MSITASLAPAGELVVVESGVRAFVGTLKGLPGRGRRVSVRSGLAGRPVILRMDEIDCVTPARLHPDVVPVPTRRRSPN